VPAPDDPVTATMGCFLDISILSFYINSVAYNHKPFISVPHLPFYWMLGYKSGPIVGIGENTCLGVCSMPSNTPVTN
jgi:hypothetical protein